MAFLIWPAVCFGAITYERTPIGYTITNPVNFSISGVFDTSSLAQSWRIMIQNMLNEQIWSECIVLNSETIMMMLPFTEYKYVRLETYLSDNCTSAPYTTAHLEYNNEIPVFEVIPPPLVELPENALVSTTAYIGSIMSDIWVFIGLAIGVPFAFYVIKKIIGVMPKK